MDIIKFIFYFSLLTPLFVYLGYPLILKILGLKFRKEINKKAITPLISFIIPAYNEEKIIEEKLENTLSLDYPRAQIQIIVASDGSTDRTNRIVKRYKNKGISLLSLPRIGKVMTLNRAVEHARGEIIVFTDANAYLREDALKKIVRCFNDPEVGGVCGNQKYRIMKNNNIVGENESLYWTYDKWIKQMESDLGTTVAADGSIYAVRRSLYVPIKQAAQADDFAISARIVTQGYRLVFEKDAISYEDPPYSRGLEFRRKIRIANHMLSSIIDLMKTVNVFEYGFYAFELISHKILRYAVPFLLIISLTSNIFIAFASGLYLALFVLQIMFYIFAVTGFITRNNNGSTFFKPSHIAFYFCLANTAVLLGILSFLRGDRIINWQHGRESGELKPKETI